MRPRARHEKCRARFFAVSGRKMGGRKIRSPDLPKGKSGLLISHRDEDQNSRFLPSAPNTWQALPLKVKSTSLPIVKVSA